MTIDPQERCPLYFRENMSFQSKAWRHYKKLPKRRVTNQKNPIIVFECQKYTLVRKMTGIKKFSMAHYANHFRKLDGATFDFVFIQIGEPGVLREIDECKIDNK
ncbi:hypothetical protein RF11_01460 [Thelohanellus kitauei]|uniref:Uncharacterized protein n=1 Tax=Thelohanellus kitauei TaxID=669202 RepID=A0A0C2J361_THEKT|nr:hypothetical protein RF11_01460 [Thelohanellus kitauei]